MGCTLTSPDRDDVRGPGPGGFDRAGSSALVARKVETAKHFLRLSLDALMHFRTCDSI